MKLAYKRKNVGWDIFLIRDNGEDVKSFVEVFTLPDSLGQRPAAYIHKVATDPEYRGKGYASDLLNEAVRFAKRRGCHKVFLICRDELIPFYQRLGFQEDHQSVMVVRFP